MNGRLPLSWVSRDGKKLLVTRMLRAFGYGYLAVVVGVYLDQLGLDPARIGVVLTAAVAGSAVMNVFWSLVADRYGRRRTVATMAVLMAIGGLVFAVTDSFLVLVLAGFTGTISATSSEVGVFQTVEHAVLPQTAPDERRTWIFSIYNMLGNFAGAFGSLFAASVSIFASLGLRGVDAYRPLFILYAIIGAANLGIFLTLSERIELGRVDGERRFLGIHRSAGTVASFPPSSASTRSPAAWWCSRWSPTGSSCVGSWPRSSSRSSSSGSACSRDCPSWRQAGSRGGSGC